MMCSMHLFGQPDKVRTHLENSYAGVKKSWDSANKAINEIQKCHLSTSLNDLQLNAGKAKTEMDEAVLQAKEAGFEADGIVGEAGNLNWHTIEDGANKAITCFRKASAKFDDASSNLASAYGEESSALAIDYLNNAISDIEKGMSYLKKGSDLLTETFNQSGRSK
ncbi:MAG TPA: hypothetical protein PKH79_03195 [Prolixibacteraceae bacterium]|nr:hypothetical protein [Prolixibacteraceae bacterium]